MRQAVAVSTVLFTMTFAPLLLSQESPSDTLFTPDQLDNLLAPVALYPDPLLAQLLVAATFPDQIGDAAGFIRADPNVDAIDGQSWDVSVKALAHYPTVINMLADQLDWATSLGQAYVNQPEDVMESVQRLRAQAQAAGNLQSDAQMQVVEDDGDIEIWPAQSLYIYVPEYDPAVVYVQRGGFYFGAGFFIGAWLNCDVNWHANRVFYHGWNRNQGWIARSRPYVHTQPGTYVNDRYRRVSVNRAIISRSVNYSNLNRYESVHRDVGYGKVHPDRTARDRNDSRQPNRNKRIESSGGGNTSAYVGRAQEAAPVPAQSDASRGSQPQYERRRTFTPPTQGAVPSNAAPAAPARSSDRAIERRQPPSAIGGSHTGGFNTRDSGQRGQETRREAPRPSEARPAPAPHPQPARSEPARQAPAPRDDGGKKK